ncbi:hypothetical protein JW879_03935 [candidate division WOR-3 bacterium]|nr:hypothetical protein [candidate division WOR-3 bacterium]
MRRFWYLVCLVILIVAPVSLIGGETKVSMVLWNRYTADLTDGKINESVFSLERGYFRIEPTFTDKIKGRFNIDLFSDEDGLDGAGLKLKYAYLDFAEVLPIPESQISIGLIKHYFGTVYDWEYLSIEKALEDKEGVAASTDYGLALFGYLPGGYGEYAVSLLNGEGYKKTGGDLDKEPEIAANLRVIPIPGVTVGGSVLYENDESERLAYAGVAHFAKGPFDLWGEYLVSDMNDVTANGFMVMPMFKLKGLTGIDVDLLGRFDMWDGNTDVDDDGRMTITAGINWNLVRDEKGAPMVFFQFQGERTMYQDDVLVDIDKLMAQIQWKFSNVF